MQSEPAGGVTRIIIPSDPLAVREALRALFDTLLLRSLPEAERGTAEIVLAEALNNIVEHAYSTDRGEIELTLRLSHSELACRITDSGAPMPAGQLPEGALKPLVPPDDLPEGGFGWFLIRTLARDLHYRRINGQNQLSFCLNAGQSSAREMIVSKWDDMTQQRQNFPVNAPQRSAINDL
jgi:serine/threonine-protein kinase RsbW